MRPVAAAAADNGMIWGLWMSLEMATRWSIIYKQHPELLAGGIEMVDFANPATRDYMYNIVAGYMQLRGFRVYRTDGGAVPALPEGPNRTGIFEMKYVAGLYEFWDRIAASWPDSFRYGCDGGGQRIDLEMIKRFHANQKSDLWFNNEVDQASIWALSQYLPNNLIETAINRMDDYTFHSMLACSMNLGWIADANNFDSKRAQAILTKYHSVAPLLIGAWYPLLPYSRSAEVWMASQYHRPDLEQGIILTFRHDKNTEPTKRLKLYGLAPTAMYELYYNSTGQKNRYTGTALMRGLSLTIPNPHQSELIEYKKTVNH
jgi:alpha-galactosidase